MMLLLVVSLTRLLLLLSPSHGFLATHTKIHPPLSRSRRRSALAVRGRRSTLSPPLLVFATTPTTSESASVTNDPIASETADAVICGGGPAGLLAAVVLARDFPDRFANIRVYDRNLVPPPHPDDGTVWDAKVAKFYLIGLGGRGQRALQDAGVWEEVRKRCVVVLGRRDWSPDGPDDGVETIFGPRRTVQTHVLPRDKLVGVLYNVIQHRYPSVQVQYGYEVHPIDLDGSPARVEVSRCVPSRENPEPDDVLCDVDEAPLQVSTQLLIAADGTIRTIANAMQELDRKKLQRLNPIQKLWFQPFRVRRYPDDNQRVYKTFALKLPWRGDLNYSARTKRPTFDALPANHRGDYCGVLLLKHDDPLAQANTDPNELRTLLDHYLPQFSKLISDEQVEAAAAKPASQLPMFRYAGPRVHQGNHCVLIGDCIHTVKPYFGLGANSALEDVRLLGRYLKQHADIGTAIRAFSSQRGPDSKTLVRLSRDLDRPGKLGILTFLIPIILDGIFGRLAPQLFRPNVITMLQKDTLTFRQVARRKRMDRLIQVSVLLGAFAGILWVGNWGLHALARAIGRSVFFCYGALVATMAVLAKLKSAKAVKSQ